MTSWLVMWYLNICVISQYIVFNKELQNNKKIKFFLVSLFVTVLQSFMTELRSALPLGIHLATTFVTGFATTIFSDHLCDRNSGLNIWNLKASAFFQFQILQPDAFLVAKVIRGSIFATAYFGRNSGHKFFSDRVLCL